LWPEGKEEVQEGGGRWMVDLSNLFGCLWGHGFDVWLDGGKKISIKRCDEIIIKPLLAGLWECCPWQVVNVPCVVERNVGKSERNGTARFGEEGDEEVRAEGDGSSDSSLQLVRQLNKIDT
jgi:hypothetical protein